ncbi:XRE family transcriptional regulator [Brumimicrobium salinarum]|uniref:XRE family transcriptional regulator n=1 Tax=Brumimicrobium salinarum TaxID=2058658 RepID=A0A2I0R0L4_9FLAO|nr:helix-turn-helix transcriptional regulator [Brumimicrobium salinarum]PKR80107.1 XRE family transcriptional regulator [Brumimicrobium salinarum]
MTFGEKISILRKQLKLSQDDLAKKIGTSAPIVGRYERGEIKPSIEVASKIADALSVSMDYLLGKTDKMILDKKTMQRLQDIEQLSKEDKVHIFYALDNLIKAAKLKNITAL